MDEMGVALMDGWVDLIMRLMGRGILFILRGLEMGKSLERDMLAKCWSVLILYGGKRPRRVSFSNATPSPCVGNIP